MSSERLVRRYVAQVLQEWRFDQELYDLYKSRTQKTSVAVFDKQDALNILHTWLYEMDLLKNVDGELALDLGKMSEYSYEAMKAYSVTRYRGLINQYRRSKNPIESAKSALSFWLNNYYHSQIATGKIDRKQSRYGMSAQAAMKSSLEDDEKEKVEGAT